MSNDYDDALGEYQAFGDRKTLLPAGLYPMQLAIREVKTSDEGVDEETGATFGGVPFVDLVGTVFDGPFKGETMQAKLRLTPGKTGGMVGLLKGACRAITRQPAESSVLTSFGFAFPKGDPKDKQYRTAVRDAFVEQFEGLAPDKRLDLMLRFLRVRQWDQKKVVVSVGIREWEGDNINPQTGEKYKNHANQWSGFYDLQDDKKGIKYVQAVEFPKQAELLQPSE